MKLKPSLRYLPRSTSQLVCVCVWTMTLVAAFHHSLTLFSPNSSQAQNVATLNANDGGQQPNISSSRSRSDSSRLPHQRNLFDVRASRPFQWVYRDHEVAEPIGIGRANPFVFAALILLASLAALFWGAPADQIENLIRRNGTNQP
jgi:hypothetical protein